MKNSILIFAFLLSFSNISKGQISITEATRTVNNYIEKTKTTDYLLYRNIAEMNSKSSINTFNKSIQTSEFTSWVFFIDNHPLKNWEHKCLYVFIDKKTGEMETLKWTLPPNDLDKWELLTEIKETSEVKLFNFKKDNFTTLKSGLTPGNCYAVIISGGYNSSNNWQRYWNDCSAIYSALVDVYNYEDDHIYVLMSDGTSSGNDRRISGGYDSSPLDLDNDGDNDIQYSATKSNITTVFNTLSSTLTNNDYLFIFFTDHGGQESGQDAIVYLWGETMRDDEFATEVNKVNAGHISVVMEQCYSGGFVDDLEGQNRVIATACDFDETSCGMGYYTYDEFVFDWIAAVAGEDPNGNTVNADSDNDGFVSMQEAFDYAESNDNCSETPQYSSTKDHLGNYLTLLGSEACTTNYVQNRTITANETVTDCSIEVENVTIQNNSNVVLDAAEDVIINGEFEVKLGSTLEIK